MPLLSCPSRCVCACVLSSAVTVSLIFWISESLPSEYMSEVRLAVRTDDLNSPPIGVRHLTDGTGQARPQRRQGEEKKTRTVSRDHRTSQQNTNWHSRQTSGQTDFTASSWRLSRCVCVCVLSDQNAGHPHPLSNLVSDEYSGASHALHRNSPRSFDFVYPRLSPGSVCFSRSTAYSSGESFAFHSASLVGSEVAGDSLVVAVAAAAADMNRWCAADPMLLKASRLAVGGQRGGQGGVGCGRWRWIARATTRGSR